MHLRRLELQNFRRYEEATIDFPDGVIGLVGRNGAGKSTIIEAVTWALFGPEAARTRKDLVKRHGAAPGQTCQVALEFGIDGEAYRVTRRMRGASLQVDLVIESGDRLLVAGGPNSTAEGTRFLQKLLGFDRESFHASVVARQGDLGALSERTPGARKQLVLRMLGIEAVEEAVQRARTERRDAEKELAFVRQALVELDRHAQRRRDLQREMAEARDGIAQATKEMASASQAVAALEKEHARLQQAKASHDAVVSKREAAIAVREKAVKERKELRAELAKLGGDRKRLVDIEARLAELAPEAGRVEALEKEQVAFQQADEWGRQRKALEEKLGHLRKTAAEEPRLREQVESQAKAHKSAAEELETLADSMQKAAADRAAHQERLRSVRARMEELEAQGHQIDALGEHAACPLCEQPLGQALDVLRDKRSADHKALAKEASELDAAAVGMVKSEEEAAAIRDEVRRRLETLRKDLDSVSRRLEEAQRAGREQELAGQQLDEVTARVAALGKVTWDPEALASARAARKEVATLETETARLSERVRREKEVTRRLEDSSEDEAKAERTIQAATNELEALSQDVARVAPCARQLDEARARREALGRKQAGLEERVKAREAEDALLHDLLAAGEGKRARRKELEETVRLMEFLASAHGEKGFLQAFKTHLISRIRPALARAASELLAAMTDGRYTEVLLDDEYEVSVYDQGEAHPLARFSGGETDVVNLALRLAINELVSRVRGRSRMDFIALDEVFGAQDSQRRVQVLAALSGLRKTFRQVLVITHHEEVQERLEHVINVVDEGSAGTRLVVVGLNKV